MKGSRAEALAGVGLSLAIALAACSSKSGPTQYSTQQLAQQGTQVAKSVAAGNFGPITAKFDATMKASLTPDQLQQAWNGFVHYFGDVKGEGTPVTAIRGTLTVVDVPLQQTKLDGKLRVSYHPDGTIAGLYFLNAAVPIPA